MKQPLLFIGHGSPMLAITKNRWRHAWQQLGQRLPRPSAILCVSAHWETREPCICSADPPQTLHDFGGFPPALHAQQYPAPGAPQLVQRVRELAPQVQANPGWGLDHGAWCVLASLFPAADVPVAQLSLARTLDFAGHLALARQLAPLRDEGVLILGSGNGVHNLRAAGRGPAWPWATAFDAWLAERVAAGDSAALCEPDTEAFGDAVPTPEHYLPLLYAQGASDNADRLETVTDGIDLQSISMRSWAWWPAR